MIDAAREALAAPADWSGIQLNPEERLLLARAAHEIRWPGNGEDDEAPAARIDETRLLDIRRRDDEGRDLWKTFNVLQENTLRGGQRYVRRIQGEDGRMYCRNVTTREVKGVDQLVGLNRALWMVTSHFAKERKSAA